MKTLPLFALLVLAPLSGCGSGPEPPPKQAVMHAAGSPPTTPHRAHWTKADKIAVVQKAPIPDDQKKAEIDKINSEPGD